MNSQSYDANSITSGSSVVVDKGYTGYVYFFGGGGDGSGVNNALKMKFMINVNDLKQGEFLGNGAFGKVYDGEYKGVAVAIKWLEMEHARRNLGGSVSEEEIIESFDWEATNLSLVNHPNIISLIGIVDDGVDRRGLVLELCDGMDLKKLLLENKSENRSMSLRQQFSIIFQLLCGLKYLHERGIIHKDVKVENVLWFRDGRVKWADLGVSAVDSLVQENEAALSQAGMKDAYWNSPEEARIRLGIDDDNNNGGDVALAASDMFSFGLIMYAVMSGEGDIWDGSGLNGLRAIQECLCGDRVSQVLKLDDSWWCYDLMRKCFTFNPQDRPTATELLELLKQWAHNGHNELSRVMLSHELILNTHSSEDAREAYIENLCSTNNGDVESFGGKDEANFAHLPRIFSLSHCVSSFIEGDADHDFAVASEPIRLKWISTKRQSRCNRCMTKFSFFRRRKHHCRVCGLVVCHECSKSKIVLPQGVELVDGAKETNKLLPVRVCDVCKGNIEEQERQEEQPSEVIASASLEIDDRVLLLLGDGGTGKSTGMHVIACKMSTNCVDDVSNDEGGDGVQFVFIRPRVQEWSMESLRGACSDIRGGGGLVFVLDGYDELRDRNVDVGGESLPEYLGMSSTSRLIVTCRRNIVPDNRISSVFGGGVRVRYLLPFTKNQIGEYLEMCGAPQPSSPISNPFVLKLYSSSWQHLPSDQELKSARLVLKDIYDASVRAWFSEACGLDDELKSELSVKNFEDFACHVAMSMFIDGNRVATSFPSAPPPLQQHQNEDQQQVSSSPWFVLEDRVVECASQLFDSRTSGDNARRSVMSRDDFIRNKLQLLTTQFLHKCPLQKKPGTQLFSFVHKSYRDYFCGMAMTRMMNVYIDKVLVTRDAAVQQWSSRFVDIVAARQHCELGSLSVGELEESTFSIRALEFIEHTRHADPSPSLSIGAANCMTVLNTAGVPLSRRNFSGAQLGDTGEGHGENVIRRRSDQPFMDLGGAMLYGCDFSGANLSGARLQQACMDHVNFTQCNMSGVEFGQRPSFIGHSWGVSSLCISPDGAYLYSGSDDKTIKQWSVSSGELIHTMKGHSDSVSSLCISPDGAHLYSGSEDRTVKQWSVSGGELLRTMEGHGGEVSSLCVSPDGAYLYSGSWDQTIKQWSVSSGELLRTMEGRSWVQSLCISPDCAYVYSGSTDATVKRWSASSGELLRTMRGHSGYVRSLCISPGGAYLYSGSGDKTIKQWSVSSGELLRTMDSGDVRSLCISPDGAYVYSGSREHTVKQWSVSSGELLRSMEGHNGGVVSLCVSPDGAYLYSGSEDLTIKQWFVSSGELVRAMEGPRGVSSLCVSPDGAYLYTGSEDHTIKQWSVSSGEVLRTMEGHSGGVLSLCVSPDGAYLYSGSHDASLKQWSVSSGEPLLTIMKTSRGEVLRDEVSSLCISPDGAYLYSGSFQTITQWSLPSVKILRVTKAHGGKVLSLCISPDGAYLFSGSLDGCIEQWSVSSGELLRTMSGHRCDVSSLCITPDGAHLFSGSWDSGLVFGENHQLWWKYTIEQWSIPSGEIVSSRTSQLGVFPVSVGSCRFVSSGSGILEVGNDDSTILWSSPPFKLSANDAIISNIKNLNASHHRLLCELIDEKHKKFKI